MWHKTFALLFLFTCVLSYCSWTVCEASEDVDEIEPDGDVESEPKNAESVQEVPFEPETFIPPDRPQGAYFYEIFAEHKLPNSWVVSKAKKDDSDSDISKYNGEWAVSAPDQVVLLNDYCLTVKSKARHHAISSKLSKSFNFNAGKPFVVQYEVKLQNGLDCGGAYLKLLTGNSLNLADFNDKTPYSIMFGPDKCGSQSKLHFIVQYRNPKSKMIKEFHAKQPESSLEKYFTKDKSHLFTLVVNADDTYKVFADQTEVVSGDLKTTMIPPIMPEKEIDDPEDKKPEDWDEREKIPDLEAKKPDDWDENAPEKIEDASAKKPSDWLDDEPDLVPDEKAVKPDDWDTEMDGEYEAPLVKNPKCEKAGGCGAWKLPMIPNPAFKGKWRAPLIDNPKYQGKWTPRRIDNPEFFESPSLYDSLLTINAVGIELWTMNDGIAFDNFLITDDKQSADDFAEKTWKLKSVAEERKYGKPSVFTKLIETANDKPWIWAIVIFIVLIPIILVSIFCFSGSKKDPTAEAKKTDRPMPDDEGPVPDESRQESSNDDEGVEADNPADGGDEDQQPAATVAGDVITNNVDKKQRSPSPRKVTKNDLEGENSNDDDEPSSKKSPRRRAARKAD